MYFLIKLLINTLALLAVVRIIPGLRIADWQTALLASIALGFVNAVIRPVVMVLTLPFNILSLGLFTFVINALLFYSVTVFVPGFKISGFPAAFFGSLVYSLISSLLSALVAPPKIRFFSRHSSRDSRHDKYRDAVDIEGRDPDK